MINYKCLIKYFGISLSRICSRHCFLGNMCVLIEKYFYFQRFFVVSSRNNGGKVRPLKSLNSGSKMSPIPIEYVSLNLGTFLNRIEGRFKFSLTVHSD